LPIRLSLPESSANFHHFNNLSPVSAPAVNLLALFRIFETIAKFFFSAY
jgi:hypothetical protein